MFDINEVVGALTGHCTLCHKKSDISILNGGVCLADKIDLDEKCDDRGVDNLLEKNGVLYNTESDIDYEKNYGD